MPLPRDTQDEIERLCREKNWGGRRIATALGLSYKQVRTYMESAGLRAFQAALPTLKVVVWDLETKDLSSDIGYLLMGSFLDLWTGEMVTERIVAIQEDPDQSFSERERDITLRVSKLYTEADILIGHNTLGYDKNYLNGIRFRMGLPALPKRFHIDTMQVAKNGVKGRLQSVSLANLIDIRGIGSKDHPSKDDWRESHALDLDSLKRIQVRCESDVRATAALFGDLKDHWHNWVGR